MFIIYPIFSRTNPSMVVNYYWNFIKSLRIYICHPIENCFLWSIITC